MNKKGFLLGEETLKIVIAVICIVFLIFLLVSVYYAVTGKEKSKQAAEVLNGANGIAKEIERVNLGGAPIPEGKIIPNPNGWFLISFVGENKKPNLCIGKDCLCICKNILINFFDRQIKECDGKGACAVVQNLEGFKKIKIQRDGTFILIGKINEKIEIKAK